MIVLSWNCRGLGQPLAIPVLRELIRVHRPNIIFLLETLAHKNRVEEIRSRIGFEGCFTVDCLGRRGGMCVIWKDASDCTLLQFSNNHIDMKVNDESGEWRLTGFYGFPERNRRRSSWNFLRSLSRMSNLPWTIIGDFNDMLEIGDKRGRVDHPNWLFEGFRNAVADSGLVDLPIQGYQFTWSRSRGRHNAVEERLDRCMSNRSWADLFPEAVLINGTAPISDHSPIILKTSEVSAIPKIKRFRFENKWLKEPELPQLIRNCWTNLHSIVILEKLTSTAEALQAWSKSLNEEDRREKTSCERTIKRLEGSTDESHIHQYFDAKRKLGDILLKEEIHWKQRAKQFWLKDGYKNTKFFHSMASSRKKIKSLSRLKKEDGSWAENAIAIREVVKDYFSMIFDNEGNMLDYTVVTRRVQPMIDEEMNNSLIGEFTKEEFKEAVFQMHPDKAPGPDGFNPAFYQNFWSIIGDDIVGNSIKWLEEATFPEGLNCTNIVLIPKIDNPTEMKDLRPIALCNVLYKIISKVLCNRLKTVLPSLIDKAQSAFVEGRSIQDNVLIAFEAIHTMKRKNNGRFGDLALKIDISKAYDRVDWGYLMAMLQRLGFCDKWIQWIKMCVCTVKYNVAVEQDLVGPILPKRGLRQGDPLSPYLFILCAEGLSAMLNYEMSRGLLHGMRIGRNGPTISHLMFADDSILFCRATRAESETLKGVLRLYEKASGQAVNFHKSGIFFSKNVPDIDRQSISDALGVTQPLNTGRYLGLPSLIGRNKKEIFAFLRDRLWRRIQGWKGKKLSKAGKEVLIKAVAQAIPSYCMTSFLLPIGLAEELERMMNSFWWGSSNAAKGGIKWMRWERMCTRKDIGGMGFRNLHLFNISMLGKIGWRLIADPDALVSKVLKAKYFPKEDFLEARVGHNPSYTWRSICSTQDLLRCGLRWRIGDGKKVRVFVDPWLKRDGDFYVRSPHDPDLHQLRVSDLITQDTRLWDRNLLQWLLDEEEEKVICNTPLCPVGGEDSMLWHYAKRGVYTVSSAYKLACSLTIDNSFAEEGSWIALWKLTVPPKVKHFIWRARRESLPTRAALLAKGVQVEPHCGVCGESYENSWHLFASCSFAEQCWSKVSSGIFVRRGIERSESFVELLEFILKLPNEETRADICMILWSIWKDRNLMIWESKQAHPLRTIAAAAHTRKEWLSMHLRSCNREVRRRRMEQCPGWHDIQAGWLKCGVDAAFFAERNESGAGIIIQDEKGNFVAAKTILFQGCMCVDEGEAMGLHEALSWIKQKGWSRVLVEVDSKTVCDAVNSRQEDNSELGTIIKSCREIMKAISNIIVKFVRRERNMLAHKLARLSKDYVEAHVWDEPPLDMEGLLHVPCVCSE